MKTQRTMGFRLRPTSYRMALAFPRYNRVLYAPWAAPEPERCANLYVGGMSSCPVVMVCDLSGYGS